MEKFSKFGIFFSNFADLVICFVSERFEVDSSEYLQKGVTYK